MELEEGTLLLMISSERNIKSKKVTEDLESRDGPRI